MSYFKEIKNLFYNGTNWFEARMDTITRTLQTIDYAHHEIHSGSHYFLEGWAQLDDTDILYVKLVTPDTTKFSHFTWNIQSNGILTTELYEGSDGGMAGGLVATPRNNNRNVCWTGWHTPAGASATILTDTNQAWTIDALIGYVVWNTTDGSYGVITDNDATTVTVAALLGGTDNDFDQNDVYEINECSLVITKGVAVPTIYGALISQAKVGGTGFKSTTGGTAVREDEIMLRRNETYFRKFLSGSDNNFVSFKASWYEHVNKDA